LAYQVLANLVLATHIAIVAFVILGLVLVIVGNLCRWNWVNKLWFRILHLGAIAVVVAESWLDITCPLTTLEMWLREQANEQIYSGGFIEHWMQDLLYYDAPPWVFVLCYSLFGVFVLASWWIFPPLSKKNSGQEGTDL
jgi:hypothetical protein